MIQRIPLSKCKLWWPAWQQGIPFTAYGYRGGISGDGYEFRVDKEMDSWLCENGDLMPVSTSRLEHITKGIIPFTTFIICSNGMVQINLAIPGGKQEYKITHYPISELSFVGDTYSLDE